MMKYLDYLLIDVMNEGLLNDFVNDIFGYDFDIKKEEYVYIQYKIVETILSLIFMIIRIVIDLRLIYLL